MSPAVDWGAAWPTRRSLTTNADEDKDAVENEDDEDEAPSQLVQSPSVAAPTGSSSPGRGIVPPHITEAKPGQAEHSVGAHVHYWSGTHGQWMEAIVTKHNLDPRGNLVTYDLDVKRGAQASKIRKPFPAGELRPLQEQQSNQAQPLIAASMVQKVPTPVSNTAAGPADAPSPGTAGTGSAVAGGADAPASSIEKTQMTAGTGGGSAANSAQVPAQMQMLNTSQVPVPPASALAPKAGGAAPSPLAIPSIASGSGVAAGTDRNPPAEDLTRDLSLSLRRFEFGERVEYWSDTYAQWMQAKVDRIRSDNCTYDLDVKRGAQRRKMRSPRRTDAQVAAEAGAAAPQPVSPVLTVPRPVVKATGSPARSAVTRGPVSTGTMAGAITEATISNIPLRNGQRDVVTSSRLRATSHDTDAGKGDGVTPTPKMALAPAKIAGINPSESASANGPLPLRNAQREVVNTSRLRATSHDTDGGNADETPTPKMALAPDKIAGTGAYPRSGSPLVGDVPAPSPDKPTTPTGASQTAPAGDDRPRQLSTLQPIATKGRPEVGRPGPVASGSVGLAAVGAEPVRSAVTPPSLLAPKAPRRLLPDSSAGPNIGTRPDSSANTSSSAPSGAAAVSSTMPVGIRGAVQAGSGGQMTINGAIKKVATNGVVTGAGGERILVQRDGDKIVVRQFPGPAAQAPLSNATPSASSQRPAPSTIMGAGAGAVPSLALAGDKGPNTTGAANGDRLGCLDGASPTELTILGRQLGTKLGELEPAVLRGQVGAALGRLSMKELSKRLSEAHVDASLCKDRKELEWLLAQNMLTRHRASAVSELPPQAPAMSERCRGVPPAGGGPASSSTAPCASTLVATGLSGASVMQKPELEVGELNIGAGKFNPTESELQTQIASLLGYGKNSNIVEMTGFRGGLNEGVWFLSDEDQPGKDLVLKLVKCTRRGTLITEAENFVKLNTDHPKIAKDSAVAFPVRIFKCLGPAPERSHRYDLVVMWKVKGERLAEFIAHCWYAKEFDELWNIFERIGETLAAFHLRYDESQHGDFQPSNVFYDQDTGQFSLIDIGGMGVHTSENDRQHFSKSLKLLADAYGAQLLTGQRSFETGYKAVSGAR